MIHNVDLSTVCVNAFQAKKRIEKHLHITPVISGVLHRCIAHVLLLFSIRHVISRFQPSFRNPAFRDFFPGNVPVRVLQNKDGMRAVRRTFLTSVICFFNIDKCKIHDFSILQFDVPAECSVHIFRTVKASDVDMDPASSAEQCAGERSRKDKRDAGQDSIFTGVFCIHLRISPLYDSMISHERRLPPWTFSLYPGSISAV